MEKETREEKHNLLVLYGSQTGTAEEVAEAIAREGMSRFGFHPFVAPMSDINLKTLSIQWTNRDEDEKTLVVFVAATTGQGDTPNNMQTFWRSLCRSSLPRHLFIGMNYAVIGLGDSSYGKYNFVGKKLFRRVDQLGGRPILDVCLGDDQHDLGYHAALEPWKDELWKEVEEDYKDEIKLTGNELPLAKFILSNSEEDLKRELLLDRDYQEMLATCPMEMIRITDNVRVTAENHWQDTRLITFDLKGSSLNYVPGDVLVVQPSNLKENIEKFFELFPRLSEVRSTASLWVHKNPKLPWSKISPELLHLMGLQPWSWDQVVERLLDIQSVPRRRFFELMASFASDELEKEKLSEFCTPKGQEDLFAYCNRPKRNILEVLQDFPHTLAKIPPDFLFDMIPQIKPRSFSIASSKKQFPPDQPAVQILVAIVEYQTKLKVKRKGLCSNWLSNQCLSGTEVPVWIDKGSFMFPSRNEKTAVIMVGPGTGIAPFRSLMNDNPGSWNNWLFFGCRHEDHDFYFSEEWSSLVETKPLEFRSAFSRDLEGKKRQYVQDKLMEESHHLCEILASKQFYIYVAGNSKNMPKDVQDAFLTLMVRAGIEDAEEFMEQCSRQFGRYQTETWS